ncbi:MAG: hypothetical protein QM762_17930 [Chryseolinea sp.]
MKLYLIALTCACVLNAAAQQRIVHVVNGKEDKIEFRSSDSRLMKVVDVRSSNPYLKLKYPFTEKSGRVQYILKAEDKIPVLKLFFGDSRGNATKLNPVALSTMSDVAESKNHVVVSDHLMLHGSGVLGIKSRATIYNNDGSTLTVLPENNDGYIGPVVTSNGHFLATNYGDIVVDAEYSLLPSPGFRIYDLNTKAVVFDLQPLGEIQSPVAVENLIVQVIVTSGRHEYFVIDSSQRQLYRKSFTVEEVGRFVRFSQEGFVIKDAAGERLLRYDMDFSPSTF